MGNIEKEKLEAKIPIKLEIEKERYIRFKKAKIRALVKMLSMFVAVMSIILAIVLAVLSGSYNIVILTLFSVYFLVSAFILGLDTLSEWKKEDEHDNDILSLKEKYLELERKYNEALKEQQKTKENKS